MRLFYDANITPIGAGPLPGIPAGVPAGQEPAALAMAAAGFEPMFMAYDGALGRARVWSKDDGSLSPTLDWSREITGIDPKNPLYSWCQQQCGWLALSANHFHPALPQMVGAVYDLESPWWSRQSGESDMTFYGRVCQQMAGSLWNLGAGCGCNITPNREGNQERTAVGAYGWPDPWLLRNYTRDQLAGQSWWGNLWRWMRYAMPSLYVCPNLMADNEWFDWAEGIIADIRRHLPGMPIRAAINPAYQAYGTGDLYPARLKLAETPLPVPLWHDMLKFLADKGCDAFVWFNHAGTPFTPEVQRLISIAAAMK